MNNYDYFIESIKESVPTHYGNKEELFKPWMELEYNILSTIVHPKKLVIKLAINFCEKYASYSPTSSKDDNLFFATMPLMIWSEYEGSPDRSLIWSNGGVTLTSTGELILYIDKEVLTKIDSLS